MSNLDEQVLAVYEAVFSLPVEQQSEALNAWWSYLASTCTPDSPCIECLREMQAQDEGGG
jgi:hypothetical protein